MIGFKKFSIDNLTLIDATYGFKHYEWVIQELIKIDGYTPLYVASVSIENATTNGKYCTRCAVSKCTIESIYITNHTKDEAKIKIEIVVAYSKNNLFM